MLKYLSYDVKLGSKKTAPLLGHHKKQILIDTSYFFKRYYNLTEKRSFAELKQNIPRGLSFFFRKEQKRKTHQKVFQ